MNWVFPVFSVLHRLAANDLVCVLLATPPDVSPSLAADRRQYATSRRDLADTVALNRGRP
jgi:hypothetical protein